MALPNHGGKAPMELLYCSAEYPQGCSRMNSTLLEGHGQCHHFFMWHHSIVPSYLQSLWGKESLHPAPQTGQGSPQAILLELCSWQPEGSILLVGQPLGLDITHAFSL